MLCDPPGHTARNSHYRLASTLQAEPLAQSFAAMNLQPAYDLNWYPDSGAATSHMTSDGSLLNHPVEYHGHDHVMVGNGTGIPITRTGNSLLQQASFLQWLQ